MTAPQKLSYTSGHFELQIDGHTSNAFLKSVDGGHWKGTPIGEAIGPDNKKLNHRGPLEVEPFTLDLGLSGAGDMLRWIQASWNKKYTRRNGVIRHADFDLNSMYEHEFSGALITETTFPALDGASKESGYLKVKIQPEHVATSVPSGKRQISAPMGTKQKMWLPSGFRFTIDGVRGMEYTNKLESFTVKQGTKLHYSGKERWPSYEPTKIEFPTISGTIALGYAGNLLAWWEEHLGESAADDNALERSGSIVFLAPNRSTEIFEIDLMGMQLKSVAVLASTANTDVIKRVKFELAVTEMKLDFKSGFDS